MNYDPNIGYCVQRVRIRYALFDHHAQAEVEVRGTDKGLEAMEWALEHHWTQLAQVGGCDIVPRLELKNAADEILVVEDEALLQVEWLKDLCVGIEILSIEPAERPT